MPATALVRSEGGLDPTPRRAERTRRHIGPEARRWLADDERASLRQALSTPRPSAVWRCDGLYPEDVEGRRRMECHSNGMHRVGFANPSVIAAIEAHRDVPSGCTRPDTSRPGVEEAEVAGQAVERGLGFNGSAGHPRTVTPPLAITAAELDGAPDILEDCNTGIAL